MIGSNFFGGSDDDERDTDESDWDEEDVQEFIEDMAEKFENMENQPETLDEMLPDDVHDELERGYTNNQERKVEIEVDMNQLNAVIAMATNEYYTTRRHDDYYARSVQGVLREALRAFAEEEDEDLETACNQLGLSENELFPERDDDAGIEE